MITLGSFSHAIDNVSDRLRYQHSRVHPDQWQSIDVSDRRDAEMAEILDVDFQVRVSFDLNELVREIKPNLPWADDHFLERIGGFPLNPGEQWKNWPWALSADKFRKEGERFSHTYMERYWPCHAHGNGDIGDINDVAWGLRYKLGDLEDVVIHLSEHPLSRQAYLPVWFPEDTGVVHKQRVPCTLGYHFLMRDNMFHCTYYIRSCDFFRHFRDDIYLSVRLQLWMLEELKRYEGIWSNVYPGNFTFHCVSLHVFRADFQRLFKEDI